MKGEAKKEDVRFFYEKQDGVLLCYGPASDCNFLIQGIPFESLGVFTGVS